MLRDLCGLQAQFSRNPQYSLWLRATDYTPKSWDDGLVKTWSHRSTMHVVPEDELGLHLSAMDRHSPFADIAQYMKAEDIERWSAFLVEQIGNGNQTRDGLKQACRAAGMDEDLMGIVFHGWGGLIKAMCYRGQIVVQTGTEKAYRLPRKIEFIPRDQARRVMIRRYFEHFGPATVRDMKHFFTGYRDKDIKPILEEILPSLTQTDIDGTAYYHAHPMDTDGELPDCVLVPGFDQLVLGYKDRSRMVDEAHFRKLINQAGIVFPAVIVRGRMRASWKIEGNAVIVTPFEQLLRKDERSIRRAVREKLAPAIRRVQFVEVP